jgi:superfamily II DNA or RNA helicase
MPELRDYQREAVASVLRLRKEGLRRLVVHLPTGAGKTVIFSELARMARRPVLVLAHRTELIEQAADKLRQALGPAAAGQVAVEQAGARAPADAKVVVASIRSLHEARLARVLAERRFGLVVYDECHHATADANKGVLAALGCFDPDWDGTLLGFTATPARADGVGLDTVFEAVACSRTLPQMIAAGWLAPLRGFRVATAADLTPVAPTRADLELEALAEAVDVEDRNALVARTIQELARDRRTLAFCVTVNHARRLAASLRAIGVPAGYVHGEMPADERARALAAFREGRVQVLTNVGVLTEGFDDPGVSCVAMARPTRSQALYVQCVGRGTRLHPGKRDCLVLDFVDASDLDLVTLPVLYGMPRDLDLLGEDPDEAAEALGQLRQQHPGFEVPPGSITLQEIKDRAAAFDPLRQDLAAELRAISGNGWASLGRKGLCLHILGKSGGLIEVEVLEQGRPGRKDRWRVIWAGKQVAQFSTVEAAVEAVDHEVDRRGPAFAAAARDDAPWRRQPAPAPLLDELQRRRAAGDARSWGQALQLLSWARAHGGPGAAQ